MSQRANIELLNCDCMDYMVGCKDNEFDLAIVDPPYGIGDFNSSKWTVKKYGKIDWNENIPTKQYFERLNDISVNRIIFIVNIYLML